MEEKETRGGAEEGRCGTEEVEGKVKKTEWTDEEVRKLYFRLGNTKWRCIPEDITPKKMEDIK